MIEKEEALLTRRSVIAWLCFLMALASYGFNAAGKDDVELQRTLNQMDAAGKTLKSFKARFSQTKYTAILKEWDTSETGEFYYARAKNGSPLLRQEATRPGKKILTVKEDKAIFYQPDIKQAKIVNLGSYKNIAEYLAVGIGQSPAKLEKDFTLSYQGNESINGEPCSILLLKPRNEKIASRFSSISLWVKKSNGILVQNKFLEPSGDYTLLTFSEEKLNVKMPDSMFEQKLPKDVDIQHF
jgi:outer membrane lipoprotein-sorting protein